jgi:carbonic anhydrase
MQNQLQIHQWFFDIEKGEILVYSNEAKQYQPLASAMQS